MSKLAFVSVLGLLASASVAEIASAQPTPASTTEPASAGPQGAAPIGAPAPAPATVTPPAPDTAPTPAAKPEPKPLWWRGTTFEWDTSATTTAVGIGRGNIGSEGDYVGFLWTLAPNIYVLDLPKDKINITTSLALIVELTNSDTTTTQHEPMLRDIPLNATYTRTLFENADKEWQTKAKVGVGVIFPTSPLSYHEGKYLTTSLAAGVSQKFKLLGKDADGLNDLTLAAKLTWNHLFSRTYTPTDESLQRLRQDATGQTFQSDQLSYNSFDVDQLIPSLTLDLPLYKDLSLELGGRLIGRFKHDWTSNGCDTTTLTGCVTAEAPPEKITYQTISYFDASLTQSILGLVDVTLGYYNLTGTLGEDGQNRNPFYSPDATFYFDLTANLDVIYAKASGREAMEIPGRALKTTALGNSQTQMPNF